MQWPEGRNVLGLTFQRVLPGLLTGFLQALGLHTPSLLTLCLLLSPQQLE